MGPQSQSPLGAPGWPVGPPAAHTAAPSATPALSSALHCHCGAALRPRPSRPGLALAILPGAVPWLIDAIAMPPPSLPTPPRGEPPLAVPAATLCSPLPMLNHAVAVPCPADPRPCLCRATRYPGLAGPRRCRAPPPRGLANATLSRCPPDPCLAAARHSPRLAVPPPHSAFSPLGDTLLGHRWPTLRHAPPWPPGPEPTQYAPGLSRPMAMHHPGSLGHTP
jgi:hypothetical protein